jgi:hypothetical protein
MRRTDVALFPGLRRTLSTSELAIEGHQLVGQGAAVHQDHGSSRSTPGWAGQRCGECCWRASDWGSPVTSGSLSTSNALPDHERRIRAARSPGREGRRGWQHPLARSGRRRQRHAQQWEAAVALVHEFDRLPRSGSTAYGFVVGIYPIPDYPVLPEPEP